ncbi:MAG TPA: M20/M25/M40 family metallo-hydrolase [Anaerolineae bacterium]|nr:M20/M25/M40 family metallo-hydrolase [Anaerolineae bacterium]HOQ98479.1 M20/M25/M40 family metallo-hydrolase [Anaerolineae bacterium]HPL29709.1 M20/M25/M40 family metallo-hydrolase [Anaerolineae bacterium]
MDSIVEELRYLTAIPALSGMEDRMIAEIVRRFKPLADAVDVDNLGNVAATFQGTEENEPSLLVFAHIDEVGLMVTKVEPNGFLRFDRIGGVPEKTLRGQFVDVHTSDGSKSYPAFIGTHAHHLTPPDQKYVVPTTDKMYIDIGAATAEEVLAKGINIGSAVTYQPNFRRVGEYHVTGKALDNRIGVVLLLALAEHLHEHRPKGTTHLVASVQEEFNIRGNMPVFARLEPDAAVCLDITSACDTPDLNMRYDIALGKGPAVLQMNFHGRGTLAGLIPHPKLRLFIERTIEEMNMPYQRQTIIGEITDDAFTLVLGKRGVAMAHLSIPMRYSHSPVETSDLRDIEAGMRIIQEVVDRFDHTLDLRRGVL